ncbi:MFS transporter, PPP family, 3-phenylpropionic acid transporter [Trypanosoma theileri]|uniref:MFS transporter, PPP family, 3-phenylpropionic acid transporter n=1 Tax=Trypanosoma theileri TaxID=67003 RepID=A0A1X0P0Y1_9TRYP|nr:MFS transporter, PPP family, 3-phenylpropionic acid transporter [Trypanosoma theileri]ORC90587.1 MFS transporter, PPP family, 3-phenylpropionic acid transporter [Trypanosoma theileri]
MLEESPVAGTHSSSTRRYVSLAPAKIGYFGTYFAFAAVQPYYGVFLTRKGFDANMVGMITALMPICNLLLISPLAYLADRERCSARISTIGAIIATFALLMASLAKDQWFVAFSVLLHFLGSVPLAPLMDQHTMSMLPEDRRNEWGLLRSYGAYGWGIGAPLVSFLITYFGWGVSGIQFAVGMMATLHCMHNGKAYDDIPPTEMHFVEVFLFVLKRKRLFVFWLAVCCMGMGYVFIGTYLFIFLTEIGAPSILLGLSVMMTVIFEIPFFRYADWLHKHFTDVELMTFAMIAWVVRVLGYSLLQNPWYVLLLEPLHGFTFGAMWLASVHLIRCHYPAELGASSVGFLTAGMFGIGPVIGNVLGGILYEALGARGMLRVTAACMGIICLLFRLVDTMLGKGAERAETITVENDRVGLDPSGIDTTVVELADVEKKNKNNKKEENDNDNKWRCPSECVSPSVSLARVGVGVGIMQTEDRMYRDVDMTEEIDVTSALEIK